MHIEKHQLREKKGTLKREREMEGGRTKGRKVGKWERKRGEKKLPLRRDSKRDLRIMIRRLCVSHFKDLITTAY